MIERSSREAGDGMEITLTIPDDVAADIQNGSSTPLSRQLLELAAIQAHESDLITEREVMEMLGFEDREELYDFSSAMTFGASTRVKTSKGPAPLLMIC